MNTKFVIQVTGLAVILFLVLGTATYYLSHPDMRGQDERGFEHHRQNFQPSNHA